MLTTFPPPTQETPSASRRWTNKPPPVDPVHQHVAARWRHHQPRCRLHRAPCAAACGAAARRLHDWVTTGSYLIDSHSMVQASSTSIATHLLQPALQLQLHLVRNWGLPPPRSLPEDGQSTFELRLPATTLRCGG
jgi:hypothetical protein